MVDEPEVQTGEGTQPKKKSKGIFFVILTLCVLLLGGGAFYAYVKYMGTQQIEKTNQATNDPVPPPNTVGEFLKMEPFVLNLFDEKGKRYLKVQIQLEVETPEALARTEKYVPMLRDMVITILTSMTFEEVITPEGKVQLREELLNGTKEILPDRVKNIYFTEFVVQ